MTKEELKQEAEEWLCNNLHSASEEDFIKAMVDIAEPREKRIKDLEKENAELENDYKLIDKSREHLVQEKYNLEYKIENLENKIEHHQEVINTLQKKNAELSEKLNRHKHDCPNCSAFGKHCPHRVNGDPYTYDCYLTVAELEKENAELKADNDARKFAMAMSEKVEKQLREENAELKKQLEMSNKVYNDNLDYSHHIEEQLTKAKELVRSLYYIIKDRIDYENNIGIKDEMWRAEQFLKDSEVEK